MPEEFLSMQPGKPLPESYEIRVPLLCSSFGEDPEPEKRNPYSPWHPPDNV